MPLDPDVIRTYGLGGVSQSASAAVLESLNASITATALSVAIGLAAAIGISRYGNARRATPMIIRSGRIFPPAEMAVPFVIILSTWASSTPTRTRTAHRPLIRTAHPDTSSPQQ